MSLHKKFAGRGMHEFYMPTTGKGSKNRRDRRKCSHYNPDSKYCYAINNTCVGPAICKKYHPRITDQTIKKDSLIGKEIYNEYYGKGIVIRANKEIVTIKYSEKTIQCSVGHLIKLLNQ